MLFEQFHLESLGHASYLVGDESTGEALVLDPRRDVDCYFDYARQHGLRIAYVIESHYHNDYLSGVCEILARQDAQALGYAGVQVGYPRREVTDGEVISLGMVDLEVLHTPGHTPEHISLLVRDRAAGDHPALLLSGGALLVGDLARPDLLGSPEDAREAARTFCRTIQDKILRLPDEVAVFPTHVAGSLCGGNIGSRLSTTVGYERRTNAILSRVSSSEGFVQECIRMDNLPAVPPYWSRMREQNLAGPALLGTLREPPALPPDELEALAGQGAVVLDTRSPEAFAGSHIPGALNVGLGTSFSTWAGTVLPAGARIILVLERPDDLWEAVWQLLRIGYPLPEGWLAGGMFAWRTSGRPLTGLDTVDVHELKQLVDTSQVTVLDVRQPSEWAAGHIPGATFVTGGRLPGKLADLPRDRVLAVVCGSGYRSSVAASLLVGEGLEVIQVLGGMSAWAAAGYPLEPPAGDDGGQDLSRLHDDLIEVSLALQARFGEREPSDEEVRSFMQEWLQTKGTSPDEIARILGPG